MYTHLTTSFALRNSGVLIAVGGVVDSFTWLNNPRVGGRYILKEETTMDFYLVFLTLAAFIQSRWDSLGQTISPATNFKYATISINNWNWPFGMCSSEKVMHSLRLQNHLPPMNTAAPYVFVDTPLIFSYNIFSSSCNLSSSLWLKHLWTGPRYRPCSISKRFLNIGEI